MLAFLDMGSYLCIVNAQSEAFCMLIMGKSRVTPTKTITISRLELRCTGFCEDKKSVGQSVEAHVYKGSLLDRLKDNLGLHKQ